MIRVIVKGKSGKSEIAKKIAGMLQAEGTSFSIQDGGETEVHRAGMAPVAVSVIVKQN